MLDGQYHQLCTQLPCWMCNRTEEGSEDVVNALALLAVSLKLSYVPFWISTRKAFLLLRQTASFYIFSWRGSTDQFRKTRCKKPNAPDKPPTLLASAAGRKMHLCHTQEGTWEQGTHERLSTRIISAQLDKTFKREQAGFLRMAAIHLPTTSFKFHTDRRLFSYQFPFFFLIRVQHEGRWSIHYDQPLRNTKSAFAILNRAKSPVMANITLSMDLDEILGARTQLKSENTSCSSQYLFKTLLVSYTSWQCITCKLGGSYWASVINLAQKSLFAIVMT